MFDCVTIIKKIVEIVCAQETLFFVVKNRDLDLYLEMICQSTTI